MNLKIRIDTLKREFWLNEQVYILVHVDQEQRPIQTTYHVGLTNADTKLHLIILTVYFISETSNKQNTSNINFPLVTNKCDMWHCTASFTHLISVRYSLCVYIKRISQFCGLGLFFKLVAYNFVHL
jgi:hypothetical protein